MGQQEAWPCPTALTGQVNENLSALLIQSHILILFLSLLMAGLVLFVLYFSFSLNSSLPGLVSYF